MLVAVLLIYAMDNQVTIRASDELVRAIDRKRAEQGVEDGNLKSRSEWLREAAREKLGVDYDEQSDEPPAEDQKGAA